MKRARFKYRCPQCGETDPMKSVYNSNWCYDCYFTELFRLKRVARFGPGIWWH